jgi:hypothetical protein
MIPIFRAKDRPKFFERLEARRLSSNEKIRGQVRRIVDEKVHALRQQVEEEKKLGGKVLLEIRRSAQVVRDPAFRVY